MTAIDEAMEILRGLPEPVQDVATRAFITCVTNYEEERFNA